jgi:hypothetical protein
MLDLPPGPVRLSRAERRELRRLAAEGRAHPDPELRRRAVAWARHPAPDPGRIAAMAAVGAAGVAALAAGAWFRAPLAILLAGLPLTLVGAALSGGPSAAAIHRVNLSALLADEQVPAAPLEVAPQRPPWTRHAAAYTALLLTAVAAAIAGVWLLTLVCLGIAVAARHWKRLSPKHPRWPLALDADGLRMPNSAVHVPWGEVSAVDLVPAGDDAHLVGVAWRRTPTDFCLALDPRDCRVEDVVLTSRAWLRGAAA